MDPNVTLTFCKATSDMTVEFSKDADDMTVRFCKNEHGTTVKFGSGISKSPEVQAFEAEVADEPEQVVHEPARKNSISGVRWTKAEDKVLIDGYNADESWSTIAGKLPIRTVRAVRSRYSYMTAEEDDQDDDSQEPPAKKARSMPPPPLPEPIRRIRWTKEEDKIVIDGHHAGSKWDAISAMLPGRTSAAVYARFKKLSLDW